jgi:hypothetical protein
MNQGCQGFSSPLRRPRTSLWRVIYLLFILAAALAYPAAVGPAKLFAAEPTTDASVESAERQPPWGFRLLIVIVGMAAWYGTQHLIGEKEPLPGDQVEKAGPLLTEHDGLLQLSAPVNRFLNNHPRWANGLLIVSSALIDGLGVFLLLWSIFGPSLRPFLGLLMLFGLRQICQALTALPAPSGMIWRYPGFPSLLVTYGVSNDLYFSGHTAMAVYGAVQLGQLGYAWLASVAVVIAVFEVAVVLVLRAHYTMDVFAGLITALYVAGIAGTLAPVCDQALARLAAGHTHRLQQPWLFGAGIITPAAQPLTLTRRASEGPSLARRVSVSCLPAGEIGQSRKHAVSSRKPLTFLNRVLTAL